MHSFTVKAAAWIIFIICNWVYSTYTVQCAVYTLHGRNKLCITNKKIFILYCTQQPHNHHFCFFNSFWGVSLNKRMRNGKKTRKIAFWLINAIWKERGTKSIRNLKLIYIEYVKEWTFLSEKSWTFHVKKYFHFL